GAPVLSQDAEDRPDGSADVEVRRAVERIEQHAIAPRASALVADDDGLLVLLGCDDRDALASPERAQQDLVRDYVELLLRLALHVGRPDLAEDVDEPCPAYFRRDDLRRDRQRGEDPGQRVAVVGPIGLLLENVALQRRDVGNGFHVAHCGSSWKMVSDTIFQKNGVRHLFFGGATGEVLMTAATALAAQHDAAGRHDEAVNELARATQAGDIDAMTELGKRLVLGDRAPLLPDEGARFL